MKRDIVEVTDIHIRNGVPGRASLCPIALAIMGHKTLCPVCTSVSDNLIAVDSKYYKSTEPVRRFIQRFDARRPVKPFRFRLIPIPTDERDPFNA